MDLYIVKKGAKIRDRNIFKDQFNTFPYFKGDKSVNTILVP